MGTLHIKYKDDEWIDTGYEVGEITFSPIVEEESKRESNTTITMQIPDDIVERAKLVWDMNQKILKENPDARIINII